MTTPKPKPTDADKGARKLRKALTNHTEQVAAFISLVDNLMTQPPSRERDEKLSEYLNALDLENDRVMLFDLDMGFEQINRRKSKRAKTK